ncbi:MAG: leucine-rich repeat domain-containing protein [Prevotella sp.]|nr:leucine-rich repeat domain-containing protein [Prevotella sp.]
MNENDKKQEQTNGASSKEWVDEFGVKYVYDSKLGLKLLECTNWDLKEYVVKEGTKIIDFQAFVGHKNLKSIILPYGLEYILIGAFTDCINLTTMELPETLKGMWINPFCGDYNLKLVSKSPVFKIENDLLIDVEQKCVVSVLGNPVSVVVLDYVKVIEENAFCGYRNLTTVKLPDGLTKIGEGLFRFVII